MGPILYANVLGRPSTSHSDSNSYRRHRYTSDGRPLACCARSCWLDPRPRTLEMFGRKVFTRTCICPKGNVSLGRRMLRFLRMLEGDVQNRLEAVLESSSAFPFSKLRKSARVLRKLCTAAFKEPTSGTKLAAVLSHGVAHSGAAASQR